MFQSLKNFSGQHALITGGSSGIGKAVAKLLAQQGANISIIARDLTKLETAKQEISAEIIDSQQKILAIAADVTQVKALEIAIQQAIAELGCPQILITSAGVAIPGYFEELSLATFEKTMAVNYFGSLYAIKAVLPKMLAARKGSIILISSGAGLISSRSSSKR